MVTQSTTKLEAVNAMLSALGESPVTSLIGTLPADVTKAVAVLDEVAREVLSRGWHFNSEDEVEFVPGANDEIVLPANIVRADAPVGLYDKNLTVIGNKLYDKQAHTFAFTESEIKLNVVYLRDFEEIPEAARRFITVRAARILYDRMTDSSGRNVPLLRDEQSALSDLKAFEGDTGDYTIFQNFGAFRVVNRGNPFTRI